MKNEYVFNPKKAGTVYRAIANAYLNKDYVFSKPKILLPDEKIPKHIEKQTAEHATYLFTIAPLNKREVSFQILDRFRWYCEDNPGFLTLDNILMVSEDEIVRILKNEIGGGFYNVRAKAIKNNFEVLKRDYDSDPRKIFNGSPVRDSIEKVSREFREYGIKTASMLALWFEKYRLAKFQDPENLLPAIDIHKMRISRMTGVIDFELGTRIRDILERDFAFKLSEFCRKTAKTKNPVSIRALDEALWIIGSEVCAQKSIVQCQNYCPVYSGCSREFFTEKKKVTMPAKKVKGHGQNSFWFGK